MRRVAVIRTLMVPVMAWVAGTIGVVAIPESSAPSAAARGGGAGWRAARQPVAMAATPAVGPMAGWRSRA